MQKKTMRIKMSPGGKVLRQFDEKKDGTGHLSDNLRVVNDTLYAATSTGSFYFNEKKQQFFPLPFNTPDSLKTIEHKIIYQDSHHNWWIGFYGKGLYRFNDIERKSNFYSLFRPSSSPEYLEMLYPTPISEDQQGNLWMGRASGSATFTKWDWRTEKFTVVPLSVNGLNVRNFI
jgi:ligand-binding sensor domain-containing protein